ncbi:MAG: NAD(P)/FAD-dependent oxidoreductase [Candidatus Onthomonas sp.]
MLQINNLRLPLEADRDALEKKAAKLLRVSRGELQELQLVKQSIDARKKGDLHLVCTVNVRVPDEQSVLRRADRSVKLLEKKPYQFPETKPWIGPRPVVVGMGPAGLFAALFLARAGIPSLVLERGRPVEQRQRDVERFWETGTLDPRSNVQFGEGGAGTFSDGKLTTGTHDPRISAVLDTMVEMGGPADVAWSFRPHVGTDVLRRVVAAIREELLRLGCEVRFETALTGLRIEGGKLTGIEITGPTGRETLAAERLILAPGHSARDTFEMLSGCGLTMEPKPFAIGVRIEHHQQAISMAQYGPAWDKLPPSDYHLACHLPEGRSAFSFCVCPGGVVVASASEPGHLVTNGMSYRARDGENINGGFLVGVNPGDYPGTDPLAGVRFQRQWEAAAYELGGRNFHAPAQLVGDFLQKRPSKAGGAISPTYRPGVTWTDVGLCLPDYVADTLRGALPVLDRKVHGFACPEAVLTGIETRSSSPLRVLRDDTLQASVRGVYPCGEGCGYAGGIMSAAVDGIRVAEAVAAW